MEMRTFDDLTRPDDRTLLFTPFGLSMAGPLAVGDAVAYQQEAIAVDLADAVPDQIREVFERLRMIHTYGLLKYDLFTVASQHAPMAIDLALRQRFVEHHRASGVLLVNRSR